MPKGVYKHLSGVRANSYKHGEPKCEICHKQLKNFYSKRCVKHRSRENKMGEKNGAWKGDNVRYEGLHAWIAKRLGKAKKCDLCGTETAKTYDWANVSYNYTRKLDDWIRLCRSCHIKHDRLNGRGKAIEKFPYINRR